MLILLEWSAAFITWFLVRAQPYWRRVEPFVRLVLLVVVTLIVTFWLSVFTYLSFYYLYVPAVEIVKTLYFKFDSQCKLGGENTGVACSFPAENITLTDNEKPLFAFGQSYKVFIELDLPESEVNRALGMFMIKASFYNAKKEIVRVSHRATMLEYRSQLLSTLDTAVFAPLYLLGSKMQKQSLKVEMFENFFDDPYRPSVGTLIELQSPQLQVYAGRLLVYARFGGLRWFMFYHPMLAAFLGVTAVFLSLNFLILITLIRRQWLRMEQSGANEKGDPWDARQEEEQEEDWIGEAPEDKEETWPEPRPLFGKGGSDSSVRQRTAPEPELPETIPSDM